ATAPSLRTFCKQGAAHITFRDFHDAAPSPGWPAAKRSTMNFEKFTERSRGFLQAAQGLALREGHQRLLPEHLLKVLLDDREGLAAGLIARAGGRPEDALAKTEQALASVPKVTGGGAGQLYMAPPLAKVFDQAEKLADKAGDSFVTVERLL